MAVVLALIALGTVFGGLLARRFPPDRVGAVCSLIAIGGSFGAIARATPNSWQAWAAMALAVVLVSYLLISAVRYLRSSRTA
jgi:hypothetical protein